MSEIAEAWGGTPAQAVRILQKGSASVAVFAITEPDMRLLMKQPWNMPSSDGSPSGHPCGNGTYPLFYTKYVLDEKVLTPVEFVHKSSGLVADSLGIFERGYLKPGYFADIAVIDPAAFKPKATYVEPVQLAEGVDYIVVNGKLTLNKGEPTGAMAGRGLLKTPPAGSCS